MSVVAALVAALVVGGGAPALGAPVPEPPGTAPAPYPAAVLERQVAAQAAIDGWRARDGADDVRFAGLVVDPEAGVVRVYRSPAAPSSDLGGGRAEQVARHLARALRDAGLDVLELPAAYSRAALRAAQDALAGSAAFARLGVRSVAVADDGSGLVVRALAPGASLSRALAAAVPVAVTLRRGDPRTAGRWSDSPPYYAGAGTEHPKGTDWCSTGFAVADTAGHRYLTTAAHCDTVGGPAWYTGDGRRRIGTTTWDGSARGLDIGLVPAAASGWVFDGAWNDTRGYAKPVAAWSGISSGMLLCASGAWSGVACDARVSETDATLTVHGHVVHGAWVEQRRGAALWGPGDSGGPVFGLTGDATGDVAVALVSAVDAAHTAPCRGRPASQRGGPCASAGLIAPVAPLAPAARVTPLLGR